MKTRKRIGTIAEPWGPPVVVKIYFCMAEVSIDKVCLTIKSLEKYLLVLKQGHEGVS